MSQQSFADLGVSRAVVRRPRRARHHRALRHPARSSSPTCSPAATCSPSRRPARARRSPSASRWSTASTPTAAARRRSCSPPRASSPARSSTRSARSPMPARCASPPSTAASASSSRPRDAARAHILVATPGRLEDLLARGALHARPRPDARPRRGRPDARHGLPPGRRPHRRPVPARAPDAVLLRHARRRGRPPRAGATRTTPRRHEHGPTRAARRPTIEHRFVPSSATERIDALVGELRGRARPGARLRAHQARRRPAGQAPGTRGRRRRRDARQQVPAPARAGARRASSAGRVDTLVATDVAARGIDVDGHLARHQLRPARGPRRLRPPRRPHRPRRAHRRRHHLRRRRAGARRRPDRRRPAPAARVRRDRAQHAGAPGPALHGAGPRSTAAGARARVRGSR